MILGVKDWVGNAGMRLCTKTRCERLPALAAMPLALVPLREGDIKSIRIKQRILPLTEGESRRRRQGAVIPTFCAKPGNAGMYFPSFAKEGNLPLYCPA